MLISATSKVWLHLALRSGSCSPIYASATCGSAPRISEIRPRHTIRVYRRDGHNAYLGRFRLIGCPTGIGGPTTNTDGIEVTSLPLGSEWPGGLLVVQDGDKRFKLVDWFEVERQLLLK
jgi:myo-inositol-hexaphosphate 3-phosphohydrolase